MSHESPTFRSHVTLILCALLHAFTHAYNTMLVPLYLLMVSDLRLRGVKEAAFVVTVYGIVYFLGSFAAGVLADRFDRKLLLGIGLVGNAAAITLMGLTRQYEILVALGVVAGLCGTLYHPAANALVPAHYPKSPGMVIGLLGIGSGIGFFVGPQYAGWRAEHSGWKWINVADWQLPLVELGVIGLLFGVIFMFVAREVARPSVEQSKRIHPPLGASLRRRVAAVAFVLGFRDLAGVATLSLASIFLQKAHGLSVQQTGFYLGAMMLISVVANPIAVWISPGKRRLPLLAFTLIAGGLVLPTVPLWPVAWVLPVLCVFQGLQLGSYSLSDAAMMERVSPAVRGRVVGLFLTVAGSVGSTGPWLMGWWTDRMKDRADQPLAYLAPFVTLGAIMIFSSLGTRLIARVGPATHPVDIREEIVATMEAV